MKTAQRILVAVTILLFAAPNVFPATYYVDQAHVSTSDANPGTEEAPWLTIQHAANTVVAGDTVIVKAGTYEERVSFSSGHSGTSENEVTFRAEPRRSVEMRGFSTRYADYLRIEGFNITNNLGRWNGGGVWVSSDYVEIVDNYFFDVSAAYAIESNWVQPWPMGIYVADNKIYGCAAGISVKGDDWLVENNEIERLILGGFDADYTRFFGNNITFRNNYFHGTCQADIGGSHTDGFQSYDLGGKYAHNIVIEGNIVESFTQAVMLETNVMPGEPQNLSNITIRNNVFISGDLNASSAILAEGIPNVTVVHNVFIGMKVFAVKFMPGTPGVGLAGTTGIIQNNIFYNSSIPIGIGDNSSFTGGYNLAYLHDDSGNLDPATDLIDIDPHLIDPDNFLGADGLPFTADDGFGLQPGSPAIDAATEAGVTEDIRGIPRPQGPGSDIGACEFKPPTVEPPIEPPIEPPTETITLDITGEGTVSISITLTGAVSVEEGV